MSFKRVIFLILAVFAVYHGFVTPLPADSDVSYRMGLSQQMCYFQSYYSILLLKKKSLKKKSLKKKSFKKKKIKNNSTEVIYG